MTTSLEKNTTPLPPRFVSEVELKRFATSPPEGDADQAKKSKLTPYDYREIANELRALMVQDLITAQQENQQILIDNAVTAAVQKMSENYETKLDALITKNDELEKRIVALEALSEQRSRSNKVSEEKLFTVEQNNAHLSSMLDCSEQYSRRNNLRVSGMELDNEKTTDDLVIELAQDMDTVIEPYMIDRSHRVGNNDDVIIKFATYRYKRVFLKNRKLLKTKREGVWIAEDLTQTRAKLLYEARVLKRAKKLDAAYTLDGNIFVAKGEARKKITSTRDLTLFADL